MALLLVVVPCSAVQAQRQFADGRLWRITKPGIEDSFVFGTIHIPDPRVAAIPDVVSKALTRSRMLAMELVPVTGTEGEENVFEELEDDGRLAPLLGAEVFATLRDELLRRGVPDRVIERLKPWAAMLKIARVASGDENTSLDERLFAKARSRHMAVASLEWIDEQVAAFDAIPTASQVALLEHALAHPDALAAMREPTIEAWLRGDLRTIARIGEGGGDRYPGMREHYRQLTRHIITDRTVVMHHRLFLPLREGRVFVAVGASHLYGKDGLLALLKQDGYRVTKLW